MIFMLRDRTFILTLGIILLWGMTCITFLVYKGFSAEIRSTLVIGSQILNTLVVIMGLRPKMVEVQRDVQEVKENSM